MKAKITTLSVIIYILSFLNATAQNSAGDNIQFMIVSKEKPEGCTHMTGITLESGYVFSIYDEEVEVVLYLQTYSDDWEKVKLNRKGSGEVELNISSCHYTGNYVAFPYYKFKDQITIPSVEDVKGMHQKHGKQPIFKITKSEKQNVCQGFQFNEAQLYTPNGEKVKITLLLETRDGNWKKHEIYHVGSGLIYLDYKDCDYTGNYKSKLELIGKSDLWSMK